MQNNDIYLEKPMPQCLCYYLVGLATYFIFYNHDRHYQALGYQRPDHVYQTGLGSYAKIVDHFSDKPKS